MYKLTQWILLIYLIKATFSSIFQLPPAPRDIMHECDKQNEDKYCAEKCVWEKQQIISPNGTFDLDVIKKFLTGDSRTLFAPKFEARLRGLGGVASCGDTFKFTQWRLTLEDAEVKCAKYITSIAATGGLSAAFYMDQTETRCYRFCNFREIFNLIDEKSGQVNVDQGLLYHLVLGQPVYPEKIQRKFIKCYKKISRIRTCSDMRKIDNCDATLKKDFYNSRPGWFYRNPDYKLYRKACLKEIGLKDLSAHSTSIYQNVLFYKCIDKKSGVIKADGSLDYQKIVQKISSLPGVTQVGVNSTTQCLARITKVDTFYELFAVMSCKQHLLSDLFYERPFESGWRVKLFF